MALKNSTEHPIRTLDDLPETGLVLWSDFLSYAEDRRLVPFSIATWRRAVRTGEAPVGVRWFGRMASHAEHVRALVMGQDWKAVKLPPAQSAGTKNRAA